MSLNRLNRLMSGRANVLPKSAAYTLTANDREAILLCTGTWTLSLLAAATAGDGYGVWIENAGTGTITIDPNGSELIEGGTTLTIYPRDGGYLYCDATGWHIVGLTVLAASYGANGYEKTAGGTIRQWGITQSTTSSDYLCTLPVSFPNAGYSVVGTVFGGNYGAGYHIYLDQLGTSSFAVRKRNANTNAATSDAFYVTYEAVGR